MINTGKLYMQSIKKCIFNVTVFTLVFFFWSSCYSSESNFFFKHLSTKDGLSQNSVYPILQDEKRIYVVWDGRWFKQI